MDYDNLELVVGAVLVLVPIVAVSAIGMWCLRQAQRRMPWFFFLAPLGSIIYAWLAGGLAVKVFPPPYDEYFASGSGLDLRGMIIILGAMLGGGAGVVTAAVICAGNLILSLVLQRREARARLPDRIPGVH